MHTRLIDGNVVLACFVAAGLAGCNNPVLSPQSRSQGVTSIIAFPSPGPLVTQGIVRVDGFTSEKQLTLWLDVIKNNQVDPLEPGIIVDQCQPSPSPSPTMGCIANDGTFHVGLALAGIAPAGVYEVLAGNCPQPNRSNIFFCDGTTSTAESNLVTVMLGVDNVEFGGGNHVHVTGAGFDANTPVHIWADDLPFGTFTGQGVTVPTGSDGSFDLGGPPMGGLQVNGNPGDYVIHAVENDTLQAAVHVTIQNCWGSECLIDNLQTICFIGQSPSTIPSYCKVGVDSNYTTTGYPVLNHQILDNGITLAGPGALAAALNDFSLPPGSGCAAMNTALGDALAFGDIIADGPELATIACAVGPFGPIDLVQYAAAQKILGHDTPDLLQLLGAVAIADGVPNPDVQSAAQLSLATAAVALSMFCGHGGPSCAGAEITANLLNNPFVQTQRIPVPVIEDLFLRQCPNPCANGGSCWGGLIGWGQPVCTNEFRENTPTSKCGTGVCELPSPAGYTLLPVPGTALPPTTIPTTPGSLPNRQCAEGTVAGMSIGYDGDVEFSMLSPVNAPLSVMPLVNYHNFNSGGLNIEIPIYDRPLFMDKLELLRHGMKVHVCGRWVADMRELWNELHPIDTLEILPDFALTASSAADQTTRAGQSASFTITTTLSSGTTTDVAFTVASGLPPGAMAVFSPATITLSSGSSQATTLTVSNVPVGDYSLVIQGESHPVANDPSIVVTSTMTVNLHVYDYGVQISPPDQTVLRGGSTTFTVSAALTSGSSSVGVPAISLSATGLPSDVTASFGSTSLMLTIGGQSTTLSVATRGPASGSLGDFAFAVQGADSLGGGHSGAANLHIYDFAVTVIPTSLNLLTTGTNAYAVHVAPVPGSSIAGLPAITLSVTGLPGQVLGSFSSGAGSALGFSSTLTVSATNAAANPGTNLVVMGTDDRVSSGGSRSSTVVLVILTPAQASQLIIDQINQLQSQGALNQGQANSLITKLSHAITSLIAKKGMPCNQLDAFVNEVNAYLQAGILTQAQVDLLLGGPLGINAIMLAIPC